MDWKLQTINIDDYFFFLCQPLTNVSYIIGLKMIFLKIVFYISFSHLLLVWKLSFFIWKSSNKTIDLLPRFLNLRIHWRLSTILKASNKSLWSNVFWYVKYIFWKLVQYTIHWDSLTLKRHNLLQNKNNRNDTVLLPELWFLSCNKNECMLLSCHVRVSEWIYTL